MSEKTFVLGLGHQKCGTTWLYKHLSQSLLFARTPMKEYQVWSGLDHPQMQAFREPLALSTFVNREKRLRFLMQLNHKFYFDHFAQKLGSRTPSIADITPSYSCLSTERLTYIKDEFAQRDIRVKAVILIRDPLARIKSAVRFNLDRAYYEEGIKPGETSFEAALEQYYKTAHCLIRTQYHHTIERAKQVFDPGSLYIGVFENMFSRESIDRLAEFLEIEPQYALSAKKINRTSGRVVDTPLDNLIKEHFGDVYRYCYKHFPETKILWSSN